MQASMLCTGKAETTAKVRYPLIADHMEGAIAKVTGHPQIPSDPYTFFFELL